MIKIDEGKCAISTDADDKYNRDPAEINIDLKAFLSKLNPDTEIVLVLQIRDDCGGVYTTLRIEGHPDRILEMCGNSMGGYFIDNVGYVWGAFGTRDFVVKAVKEEAK